MMAIVAKGDALNTDELQKVFDSESPTASSYTITQHPSQAQLHSACARITAHKHIAVLRAVYSQAVWVQGWRVGVRPLCGVMLAGIEDVDAVVCSLGGSVADPRVDSQVRDNR